MFGCNAQKIGLISHALNAAAVACLVTCLVTDQWLTTEERVPDPAYLAMATPGIKLRNISYDMRLTHSGMWKFCQQDAHQQENCFWIDHDLPDHSHVDPRNATTCIVYAAMISLPSLLSAASVTLVGLVTNALIKCRKIWIFVTGIIYILAGICTFTCIVLYISYIIQELENKVEDKTVDGDWIFRSSYGYSTYLAMISFCCQELGGISFVYLSVSRFNIHWAEKDHRLAAQHRQLGFDTYAVPEGAARFPHNRLDNEMTANGPLYQATYSSSTWNGRLTDHEPYEPRSLSANVSPASMTRKYMTTLNPDLDVRSQDVYVGNHIKCTYDKTAFMTPFAVTLRGDGASTSSRGPESGLPARAPAHHYQRVPTSSSTGARQVTFSPTPQRQTQVELDQLSSHGVVSQSLLPSDRVDSRGFNRRNQSQGRRHDDWRMTPV